MQDSLGAPLSSPPCTDGVCNRLPWQAGWAAATKFVNQAHGPASVASLARIEKMDFLRPMHIGEVAIVEAQVRLQRSCLSFFILVLIEFLGWLIHNFRQVTYVSEHSIEVMVTVQAENVVKGTREVTNKVLSFFFPHS